MDYVLERKTITLEPDTSSLIRLKDGAQVHSIHVKNDRRVEIFALLPIHNEPDESDNSDE